MEADEYLEENRRFVLSPSIRGIEDASDANKEDDYTLYQLDNRGKHGA